MTSKKMSIVLFVSGLAACSGPEVNYGQQVDSLFADRDTDRTPGCSVAVARNGEMVLERSYGMAELEQGVANTPQTIFEAGSVSKQFTAAAVILLVLDGKVALDDDVRQYIPEVPDYGGLITLRHMMTHSSGLRDWGSVASISGWGREQRSHNHDHVLDIVSRQTELNFEPGSQYSYSNTGYNLLAIVVTRVSGMSFAEFSRTRIFEPLGMNDTQWRDDFERIVPRRSAAYDALSDGSFRINRPIEYVHGNGGLLTTVGDLVTWTQSLTDGTLAGPEFVRMMQEPGSLKNSTSHYAGGLRIDEFEGVRTIRHNGSTAGYRAHLARYPDQELIVALLCNVDNVSTTETGAAIARIYLGSALKAISSPETVDFDAESISDYQGLYRDSATGSYLTLEVRDGMLYEGETRLYPTAENIFQFKGTETQYVFTGVSDGTPSFRVDSWENPNRSFDRVEAWNPSTTEMNELVGTYHSDDAETTFLVALNDTELTMSQRPNLTHALTPVYHDAFQSTSGAIVRFRRNEAETINALSHFTGRVFDMRFTRKQN